VPKKNHRKYPIVNFYWRKLAVFAFLFAVLGLGYTSVQTYKADTNKYTPPTDSADLTIALKIAEDGSVIVDGQKLKQHIDTSGSSDELILPILDNTGIGYSSVHILMTLPKSVVKSSIYEIKGIHGVDSTSVAAISDKVIDYYASGVGPDSTLSVIIEMPPGTVDPPLLFKLYAAVANIKSSAWYIVALALPILTLIFMIGFITVESKQQKIDIPDKETDSPPMALPPAIAGVLYHQNVGPREIASTLVDLAERGNIYILDKERDFAFVKNRYDQRLLSYEKVLLSKIFRASVVSDGAEIEQRINNHLYSKKISLVASGIYVLSTRLGYFKTNPQRVHRKYQIVGMGAFFTGLACFLLSMLVFTNPPYILFFWAGMMLSGLIITVTARRIPNRTAIGQEMMSNWLAFRKYLSNPEKIPFSFENQELFQKNLPYAIVLDCEVAWAKRFSEQDFVLPNWYVSDELSPGLQDFCLSLFPIVSYVARSLASLKEPGFE